MGRLNGNGGQAAGKRGCIHNVATWPGEDSEVMEWYSGSEARCCAVFERRGGLKSSFGNFMFCL